MINKNYYFLILIFALMQTACSKKSSPKNSLIKASSASSDESVNNSGSENNNNQSTLEMIQQTGILTPMAGTYTSGALLRFEVSFEEAISVTGVPVIQIDVGGEIKEAFYSSGSDTNVLEFVYEVSDTENDSDGISYYSNSGRITLSNGASLSPSSGEEKNVALAITSSMINQVYIDNASGIVAPSKVLAVATAPSSNSDQLSVSWSRPNSNGTSITEYLVQYRQKGHTNWTEVNPRPTIENVVINGMQSSVIYELRVAANNGLVGPFSNISEVEIFNLSSLSLALWLDATDSSTLFTDNACTTQVTTDGDAVACWRDKSGFNRDFLQVDSAFRPLYLTSSIGGLKGLDFEGGQFLEDEDGELYVNGFDAFEFFVVVESDQTNTDNGVMVTQVPNGGDNAISIRYDADGWRSNCVNCVKSALRTESSGAQGSQVESLDNTQTLDPQILGASWSTGKALDLLINGESSQMYNDGVLTGLVNSSTTFILGKGTKDNASNRGWDGRIVEVIFLNTELSLDDRSRMMNYLKTKYQIP